LEDELFSRAAIRSAAWLARRFPNLPGRWRVVRWLQRRERELAALPPQEVRLVGSLRMRVDPRDENGRRVFVEGYDPRERLTRLFIELLRPDDNVLDIGANVGYYSMVASHLVGPGGAVHAFEASPYVLPWLEGSVRVSGARGANIHVHGVAVADRCGEIAFHAARPEKTGFSSIRDLGSETAATTTVPCTSIDALLDTLPRIRLVKMDIEGAELLALRGMARLIERDQPRFILEIDDEFLRALGGSAQEVFEFLHDRQYQISDVVGGGDLAPLRSAPPDRRNIFATPVRARIRATPAPRTGGADRPASQMTPAPSRQEIAR
jgi:FkbM family methyltransferase